MPIVTQIEDASQKQQIKRETIKLNMTQKN